MVGHRANTRRSVLNKSFSLITDKITIKHNADIAGSTNETLIMKIRSTVETLGNLRKLTNDLGIYGDFHGYNLVVL
jgi:hypothetical protein